MKEKKIIFLTAFLHSGLDWVHSLLDSHPQLLITPALSFYRCWTKFDFNEFENGKLIYDKFYKYIRENIGPNSENEQKKFLHTQQEQNDFFIKLSDLLKDNLISRKEAFLFIHESYIYAKKIDQRLIKAIISHEHLPIYKQLYKKDFPKSSLILVLRDPRAALAGIWYRRDKLFGHLPDYTFNMTIDCWLYAINIVKDKFYKNGKNLFILKNEDLHNNIRNEMLKLSNWLQIDFDNCILYESFPSGKTVFVDSAYLLGDKPNDQSLFTQKIPDDYFKIENVTARWRTTLSNKQIVMIEGIFSICFKKFGYKKLFNDNLFNKILSFIFFLIPQKKLLNYWVETYPDIDAFERIYKRLTIQNKNFLAKIWSLIPNFMKFISLFFYSIFSRVKILLNSKENTPTYDKVKKF
jgi:hypothetical protein